MSDAILDPTAADVPAAEPGPALTPIQEATARLKELYPDVVSDETRLAVARAETREQGFEILIMAPEFLRR